MLHPFRIFSAILIIAHPLLLKMSLQTICRLQVTREDADTLGHRVCDPDADSLATSGQNFLKQLNQCKPFTPDQLKVIQDLLSSGNTPFGPPSTWSSSTLDKLSGLLPMLPQNILQNIPEVRLKKKNQIRRGKRQVSKSVRKLRYCPPDKAVTEEVLQDKLMPIYYTPEELGACLKGQFLLDHLPLVTSHAYTDRQMFELKLNLDREFPDGYPEWVLYDLGVLLEIMSEEEIKKWNITSPETLRYLLDSQPTDDLASSIIQRYVDHGNPLNATALDAIGPRYICLLNVDQLRRINEQAIKMAKPLQVSKCSQTTVNTLYPKAKRAFSDRHNEFPAYYDLIKPYLSKHPTLVGKKEQSAVGFYITFWGERC
ncbi:hypothetical protein JRQ81_010472 [Phrynocephalus forsythii]|uniref:Mesothelin n=1 Tax=Phrynocephalus forsythii TaxID=171643 RepID=A0A9Q0X8J9_9SAUR|nr:hypothetical protein JRQ81_010472 [Phrynocephalus forsythii]